MNDDKKYYNRVYMYQQRISCIECELFESMIDVQKSTALYKNEHDGHCNYVFPLYNSIATIYADFFR